MSIVEILLVVATGITFTWLIFLSVELHYQSGKRLNLEKRHEKLLKEFEKQSKIGVLRTYGFPWGLIDLKEAVGMIINHLGLEYTLGKKATAAKFVKTKKKRS